MEQTKNFEGIKDYLTAMLLMFGASFLALGSIAFIKYLAAPLSKPHINVEIGEIDASKHVDVKTEQRTDCGLLSWGCGSAK